jgi:hypothetical protein
MNKQCVFVNSSLFTGGKFNPILFSNFLRQPKPSKLSSGGQSFIKMAVIASRSSF